MKIDYKELDSIHQRLIKLLSTAEKNRMAKELSKCDLPQLAYILEVLPVIFNDKVSQLKRTRK